MQTTALKPAGLGARVQESSHHQHQQLALVPARRRAPRSSAAKPLAAFGEVASSSGGSAQALYGVAQLVGLGLGGLLVALQLKHEQVGAGAGL